MPNTTGRRRVLAGVLTLVLATLACGTGSRANPTTPPAAAPTTAPATATPTTAAPAPATSAAASTPQAPAFRHQPLFPFEDLAQVAQWQQANRQGTQPWHLDAAATATAFAQGFLGFSALDRVTSTQQSGPDAWIGVGQALPDGRDTTAAVVHLTRWGDGADAPWEVVGTRDTTLTLDTPAYGTTVTSPLTVGGVITGVDESLRVQVRRSGTEAPLGTSCCLPAGGQATRWSTRVTFSAATGRTVTVVVSTGGHVAEVERFAVTGVRAR
jgi:hypothetical protein